MPEIGNHLLVKRYEGNGAIAAHGVVDAATGSDAGKVKQAGANSSTVVGVYDNPKAAVDGDEIGVVIEGSARCVASAAIAIGQKVAAAANGRVAVATTGQNVIGSALTAASAAGEGVTINLNIGAGLA